MTTEQDPTDLAKIEDLALAEQIEHWLPNANDRYLVFSQLLRSINLAQNHAKEVWSLTARQKKNNLFQGFRLNVGGVEVLTVEVLSVDKAGQATPISFNSHTSLVIRLLLHGNISQSILTGLMPNYHFVEKSSYQSVPQPQWVYFGMGDIREDLGWALSNEHRDDLNIRLDLMRELHSQYIHYAAHTSTGKLRSRSNLRGSHREELYQYALQFCNAHEDAKSADAINRSVVSNNDCQELLDFNNTWIEGALLAIKVNRYERNPKARAMCIAHYGYCCNVCGFDFQENYGDIAQGLIHVHHLISIASIGETYEIDPIKDLRPVCANCHAVIHRKQPPYSIEEVKAMLK